MKKRISSFFVFAFLFITSAAFCATNAALEGIKANQSSISNRLKSKTNAASTTPASKTTNTTQTPANQNTQTLSPAKRTYIPHTYGFLYVGKDSASTGNTNEAKNNQTETKTETKTPETKNTNEQKITEETQEEKDAKERAALRKKYSRILSNKTTVNEVMCKRMEECFPDADAEELDRLLNDILYLNCDICKLRSDYKAKCP